MATAKQLMDQPKQLYGSQTSCLHTQRHVRTNQQNQRGGFPNV